LDVILINVRAENNMTSNQKTTETTDSEDNRPLRLKNKTTKQIICKFVLAKDLAELEEKNTTETHKKVIKNNSIL